MVARKHEPRVKDYVNAAQHRRFVVAIARRDAEPDEQLNIPEAFSKPEWDHLAAPIEKGEGIRQTFMLNRSTLSHIEEIIQSAQTSFPTSGDFYRAAIEDFLGKVCGHLESPEGWRKDYAARQALSRRMARKARAVDIGKQVHALAELVKMYIKWGMAEEAKDEVYEAYREMLDNNEEPIKTAYRSEMERIFGLIPPPGCESWGEWDPDKWKLPRGKAWETLTQRDTRKRTRGKAAQEEVETDLSR